MPNLLEFVAFSDAELQWLVAALQAARASLPWRPLSLRAHDGAWILRVQGPAALYHKISSAQMTAFAAAATPAVPAVPPAVVPQAVGTKSVDRLGLFMRDACKAWPPGAAKRPPRSDPKTANDKDARDPANGVKSALAKKGKFAGANWCGHSFAAQDLRGADFSGADVRGADFHAANLQGASFRNAQLGQPQAATGLARWRLPAYQLLLDKARFLALAAACLLVVAVGLSWLLQGGYAAASLAGLLWVLALLLLDQQHARWREALANGGTRFDAANLLQADFSGAHIGLVNFEQAQLQQVRWHGAAWQMSLHFSDPVLQQHGVPALLAGQRGQLDFSGCDLSAQNLSGLDLAGVDFSSANLQSANLSGCNLQGARLVAANLRGANLSLANLSGADVSGWQIDHQTGLAQLACDFWYDSSRTRAVLPGTRLPVPVPPARWPTDCGSLRPGEFVHLIAPRVSGIRFLAANLTQCQTCLDMLLQLARNLPIRLQQILFDADPAAYGMALIAPPVPEVEPDHAATGEAERAQAGQAETGYQIEVEIDASVDTLALCQVVWLRAVTPLSKQHREADRLLDCLRSLAG